MIDVVFSAQLALAAIAAGAIYALVATGLNLVYGTLRLLNIAHGDFVMIGAYLAFWVFTLFDFGPALSLPLSVVIGTLLGLATYKGLVSVLMQGTAPRSAWKAIRCSHFSASRSSCKTAQRSSSPTISVPTAT